MKSGVAPDNAPVAAARSAGRAPPLLRGTVFIRSENQYSLRDVIEPPSNNTELAGERIIVQLARSECTAQ